MTISDISSLSPLIVIAVTAVAVMLSIAFYRCHSLTVLLTLAGIIVSFAAFINIYSGLPRRITELLVIDHYAFFYIGLILAAGFIVVLLSYGYLEKQKGHREEFYLLLLLSILGAAVLVVSSHFASLFLGLEILSVSLYSLIAYLGDGDRGIEAGIKYLILASASAAFLLLGMAFVYAETGTMSFARISSGVADAKNEFLLVGTVMIIVGIGFKLAVVPFHMWTPDVYEGAPAPVSAFIATVSKGAVFAFLLRYFTLADIHANYPLFLIFSSIAVASMFFGNLLALLQNNVKRILAYSSIAHFGYLLVAFLAGKTYAFTAVTIYLVAYFIASLGAFGVITVFSGSHRDADTINDYQGMAWKRPWPATVFTVMLLSLAGIPLTAGFIGKFYILKAGIGSSLWLLVLMLAINSAIGLFYYLRVVVALFRQTADNMEVKDTAASVKISPADSISLAVLTGLLLWLGVNPSLFIEMIQKIGSKFT
jgi:NADH-quinone oxidoreductase subunit N